MFEVFEPKEGMGIDRAAIPNILQVGRKLSHACAQAARCFSRTASCTAPGSPCFQALGFNPTLEHVTEVEERIVPRGPDGTIPEDANIQLEPFLRELPRLLADTKARRSLQPPLQDMRRGAASICMFMLVPVRRRATNGSGIRTTSSCGPSRPSVRPLRRADLGRPSLMLLIVETATASNGPPPPSPQTPRAMGGWTRRTC